MRRWTLLLMLLALLRPAAALADAPPAIPCGDLTVQAEALDAGGALAVYTGPGMEWLRAADGKAAVSPKDWVQVFCTEDGYTLVQYEVRAGRYRFGWVKGAYTDQQADFCRAKATIQWDAALTDDPLGRREAVCMLPAGTPVTWLGAMGSAWIYVEAETAGTPVRGFVLRDHLRLEEPEKVYADALYPIRVDGLWGYMDYRGRTVIAPQFAWADEFRGAGYATAVPVGSTWQDGGGIINRQGDWVVPPEYSLDTGYDGYLYGGEDTGVIWLQGTEDNGPEGFFDLRSGYFSGLRFCSPSPWVSGTDNLIAVCTPEEDGWNDVGFVDRTTGELALDFRYGDTANPIIFCEGYAVVCLWDEEGLDSRDLVIDKAGRELALPPGIVLDPFYGDNFSEGLLAVMREEDGLYGFIDTEGKLAIAPQYSWVECFSEGLCCVYDEADRAGYINRRGEWVIPPRYDSGADFSLGTALVSLGDVYILLDAAGQELACYPGNLGGLWCTDYGVGVTCDGLMLNTRGQVLLEPGRGYRLPEIAYDNAFDSVSFEEGLQAMVSAEGRMGYLDTRGQEAIAFAWDRACRFRHGLALVEKDGRLAYIDHDGDVVWQEP